MVVEAGGDGVMADDLRAVVSKTKSTSAWLMSVARFSVSDVGVGGML